MTVNRIIDAVRVRDQLGKPDSKGLFGPFKTQEKLKITELPSIAIKYNVGAMAVWDDPDTTWDGTDKDDEWLDYQDSAVKTVTTITNVDNTFIWRFTHIDSFGADNIDITNGLIGANTDCTIDTTDRQAEFTAGEILEIVSAFKDSSLTQEVVTSSLNVTETDGSFTYQLSSDGGETWGVVDNGGTISFNQTTTVTGDDIVLNLDLERNPKNAKVFDQSQEHNNGEFKINATMYHSDSTCVDKSTGSNNGAISGAVATTDHLGQTDGALLYDGVNDYVEIAHNTNQLLTSGGFVGAWINVETTGGAGLGRIVDKTTATNATDGFHFYVQTELVTFNINNGTARSSAAGSVPLNTDRFVLATWDSTGLTQIYVNGVLSGTPGITSAASGITTTNALRIGNRSGATDRTFKGKIGKTFIGSVNLTAAEVLNLYNVTSVHDLDKPLVTKTDSDGNSITGLEFWSGGYQYFPVNIQGRGMFVELQSNLDAPKNNHVFYFEYLALTNNVRYHTIAIVSSGAVNGYVTLDTLENSIRLESTTNNVWTKNIILSGIDIDDGKIHKYLIEFNSDLTRAYVDENLVGTTDANNDSLTYFRYRYFGLTGGTTSPAGGGMNGVLSEPIIINRILTEAERTALFAGQVVLPIKGSDLRIRAVEDAGSTGTITKITNKYTISE